MIAVFVVEDEAQILKTTLAMLEDLPAQVVGSASNVEEAFRGIISKQPELVLLDIELGSKSSFDLLQRFDEIPFQVVFTTAHQKYAFEAFKFSAIDYLLKPLSFSLLEETIKKAQVSVKKNQLLSVQTLQHNLNTTPEEQKLILKTQDKIHVVKLSAIIRCDSDLSYTIFFTDLEKIIVSRTLGYYDDLLAAFGFYRIHKSHLINLQHIVQIHKSDGGEVEMVDGTRIGISQRRREDFFRLVDKLGLS